MKPFNLLLIFILVIAGVGACSPRGGITPTQARTAAPLDTPAVTAPAPTGTTAVTATAAATQPVQATGEAQTTDGLASLKGLPFEDFVDRSYRALLARDPETRLILGLLRPSAQMGPCLTDLSDAYIRQTQALESRVQAEFNTYDRAALPADQQRTYDIYAWYLDDLVRAHPFVYSNYPVTFMVNSVNWNLQALFTDVLPVASEDEAQGYLACLSQVRAKINQLIAGLQRRAQGGVVLPKFLFDWTLPDLNKIASDGAAATPFYTALDQKLSQTPAIRADLRKSLLTAAAAEIDRTVIPAYQDLMAALKQEQASAPTAIGAWSLPDGAAYYTYTLHHQTSTDLTPDAIHALGKAELKGIQAEMRRVFDQLGYPKDASLTDLYNRVATEGGTLEGPEIRQGYETLIQVAEARVGDLFDRRPKTGVIVKDDPNGGFYMAPSLDGSRPGAFFARVTGTEWRYSMPTLAFHEAVPGHHFQLALMNELNLPLFQMAAEMNGFVEGWGLYAERLMWENGVYNGKPGGAKPAPGLNAYGELGFWQAMARRAARMVVDTGIHAQRWTFNQSVDYMVKNTGLPVGIVQNEVGRMAVWPGQATAYYLGYLKIMELRQKVKDAMGDRFDLKQFHDLVIANGPMPLSVLEKNIDDFLSKK